MLWDFERRKDSGLGELLGGAEGIRTPDLINAIDALSQLSYSPTVMGRAIRLVPLRVRFSSELSDPTSSQRHATINSKTISPKEDSNVIGVGV